MTIDRLSSGGRGVGRHEGIVIFVPDTAPDERVLVEITSFKKKFAEARLIQVLRPSPFRMKPVCGIADICGGCTWQHVSYEEQLRQKRAIVADALRKFAGRGEIMVQATVPSPNPLHYRNRIQVHYRDGEIGFFRRGTHQIADRSDCYITDPRLNEEVEKLRQRLKATDSPPVRKELYLTGSGQVVISDESRYKDELGFAQVNQAQNERLIEHVVARVGTTNRIFDLYAGAGNFSFPLSTATQPPTRVIAVELHPKSVEHGRSKSANLAPKADVRFTQAPVEEFLNKVFKNQIPEARPEDFGEAVVVLDPPRAGCDPSAIEALSRLVPKRIVYVSCDPVTLARDIGRLSPELYRLVEAVPFDMFPQTDHVESVVVLERIKKPT